MDLFFVLSGFLITGILYDTRNTQHRFRNFYVRRTLRIFPLYYGLLIVGLLLTPIFHWIWHPVWILWPLYLGNYGRFIWLGDWMQGTGVLDHLRSSLSKARSSSTSGTSGLFVWRSSFTFYSRWPSSPLRTGLACAICASRSASCVLARVSCAFTWSPKRI